LNVAKWPPSLLRPNIAVTLVLFRRNVPHREGDRKFFVGMDVSHRMAIASCRPPSLIERRDEVVWPSYS